MNQPKPELKIPCEIYSRVVGYYRPISQCIEGKMSEFKDRRTYNIDKIKAHDLSI